MKDLCFNATAVSLNWLVDNQLITLEVQSHLDILLPMLDAYLGFSVWYRRGKAV